METATIPNAVLKEAGRQKVVVELHRPGSGDSLSRQAELILEAARGGASALIVLVSDTEAVSTAIGQVRHEGKPVVVIGYPVVTTPPVSWIDTPSYEELTRELVASALEDARAGQLSTEAPVFLLIRESGVDPYGSRRRQALETALREAGLSWIEVPFASNEADAANALERVLQDHGDSSLVFATDDFGMVGAEGVRTEVRRRSRTRRTLVISGFLTEPLFLKRVQQSAIRSAIDWNLAGMGRAALRAAVQLARGESVPERIEVEAPLVRSPLLTTLQPPDPEGPPFSPPES
jgi:ABC-type sugar transport system substrate-binding protein